MHPVESHRSTFMSGDFKSSSTISVLPWDDALWSGVALNTSLSFTFAPESIKYFVTYKVNWIKINDIQNNINLNIIKFESVTCVLNSKLKIIIIFFYYLHLLLCAPLNKHNVKKSVHDLFYDLH